MEIVNHSVLCVYTRVSPISPGPISPAKKAHPNVYQLIDSHDVCTYICIIHDCETRTSVCHEVLLSAPLQLTVSVCQYCILHHQPRDSYTAKHYITI